MTKWIHIADVSSSWNGEAHHIRLDRLVPISDYDGDVRYSTQDFIVSAVNMYGVTETLAFPARPDGSIIEYRDMPGSLQGVFDWKQVANNLVKEFDRS